MSGRRPLGVDSSTAAVPQTKYQFEQLFRKLSPDLKIKKKRQQIFKSEFQTSVPQF